MSKMKNIKIGLKLKPETISILKNAIYKQVLKEDESILDETDIKDLAISGTLKSEFFALVKPDEI